jgi:ribonuclease HII
MLPSLKYEKKLWKQGKRFVAGVDEVGRGALAGPLVAAAVILPENSRIPGLNDSKKLSFGQREKIFQKIKKVAMAIGIGKVSHRMIDKINIGQANLLAMKKAVENLKVKPDYLLIDGERNKIDLSVAQEGICKGDARCASIAAASIIAKVTRDRIMIKYAQKYPQYYFEQHKGYGTQKHLDAIQKHGPCPIHRRSFFPFSQFLKIKEKPGLFYLSNLSAE